MAKKVDYDKLVSRQSVALITTVPLKWRTYKKIDIDSVPAGYIAGVSISVMDNTSSDDNISYMFYAALDNGGAFDGDRVIAHAAISPGGGNAYLRLGRRIWNNEDGEVGGPITVWVECSDTLDSTTVCSTGFTLRLKVEA